MTLNEVDAPAETSDQAATRTCVEITKCSIARSNKAITSSWRVKRSIIERYEARRLAGMNLCLIQNGASDGICLAISRDNRRSVRFGTCQSCGCRTS